MKTNLKLEIDALKMLREEYKIAVTTEKSLFILMEIRVRLEAMKEICLEDMLEQVG